MNTDPGVGPTQQFHYRQHDLNQEIGLQNIQLSLLGAHQCANASLAVAALYQMTEKGWSISDEAIRAGLAAARCTARVEVLQESPTIILDVAHNVASMEALAGVLRQRYPAAHRTVIFASSRDKDVQGMLEVLLPACETLILTRYLSNPRAMDAVELDSMARSVAARMPLSGAPTRILVEPTPASAWNRARQAGGDLICVTGSFFLAADMMEFL
jgi:dihydrofolate synthase/folylpolyglutamate synthase